MKKTSIFIVMSLFLFNYFATGNERDQSSRYVIQQKLSTGLTVVIAEGDFEPRSIGSYSLRIYAANPEYPTDEYLSGTIRSREGSIENVKIQDLDKDGTEEIIVIIRSAGTGGYLSADAFNYQSEKLHLVANVTDLPKNTDLILKLTNILKFKPEDQDMPDKQ